MENNFENSFNLIGQLGHEIFKIRNKNEIAEKKILDYEIDLFNKTRDNKNMNKTLENYRIKMKEAELKIYELQLNLREEKMNSNNKFKNKNKNQTEHFLYINDH